jgi:hypothetical protein
MADNKYKILNYIIKKGMIKHSEIVPVLNKANLQQMDPDNIAELVKQCRFKIKSGTGGFVQLIKSLINRIFSIVFGLLSALIFGELAAVKAFADTIIAEELKGFGDQFLYWLGLRSISVTGPEMIMAMTKVVEATPKIVEGMIVGFIVGLIIYGILSLLLISVVRKILINIKISRFIKNHS